MRISKVHLIPILVLIIMTFFCPLISSSPFDHHYQNSDGCDWEGSGSMSGSDRVVIPVYLRCSHGTIKWFSPRGGLRIVLRLGSSNKDFRGCIRIARNVTSVRMYIEGHRQLHHLYANNDGKHIDLLRCFVSNNGKIAIFIESETNDLMKDMVKFSYNLESVHSKNELFSDYEECRPCDDHQMITQFCTSDFIMDGTITSLYHNELLQRSELTVRVNKVMKDLTNTAFHPSSSTIKDNRVDSHDFNSTSDLSTSQYGIVRYITLHRPLKCGTRAGTGTQFLFFGRWVLGNPVISCAPKLSYWKHIKSKAIQNGAYQCQLD